MSLFSSKTKSNAEIVDGKLILSCPGAIKPVVWQMDLASVKASALEIEHNKDKKSHILILKTARGETSEIVSFTDQTSAFDTLMKAAKALSKARGKIQTAANTSSTYVGSSNKAGHFFKTLLLLALGGALTVGGLMTISLMGQKRFVGNSANTSAPTQAPPQNGVPLSADDFLRGR